MKKKNKTEKEKKKKPHSPASRAGRPNPRDQTTSPALHFSPSAGPRAAASRPRLTARGPRFPCCRCRWTPPVSLSCSSSPPAPQLPCDRGPTTLAGAGQGVTPGAWPCSPLRRAHATSRHRRVHRTPFHRTMPNANGGMELGYKAMPRALGNLSATIIAWWPSSRTALRVEG